MSTIIAEVLMVVIVIIMSTIIYVWVVPAFTSQTGSDNTGAAYSEKFKTIQGSYASFVQSIPETVDNSPGPDTPYTTCTSSSPITSPTSANIFVPIGGVCVITAQVGNVFVSSGANLTVIGATIHGDLTANYSASLTLTNANVYGFTGLYNVNTVTFIGSAFNTSGNLSICHDGCGAAMYGGGRGAFTMIDCTVTGQVENEVGHQTSVVGNTVSGRLEIESADLGQIINNTVGSLDMDQNGVIVVSGNHVNGTVKYGTNGWCGTGNNYVAVLPIEGSCVGNTEVDIMNTGSIPVNLVSIYLTNAPLAGTLSWRLASGNLAQCGSIQSLVCTHLPIIIPVGDIAQITMGWTPPAGSFTLPWTYIYFIFVSQHQNFVDGYLYYVTGLNIPMQSRLENRICPPCW
jgi:hypothetical protein